jgi:hypothetical protein
VARRVGVGEEEVGVPGDGRGEGEEGGRGHWREMVVQRAAEGDFSSFIFCF